MRSAVGRRSSEDAGIRDRLPKCCNACGMMIPLCVCREYAQTMSCARQQLLISCSGSERL